LAERKTVQLNGMDLAVFELEAISAIRKHLPKNCQSGVLNKARTSV